MEYYLWTKNGQQGPFTREELETMYRTGQLLEPDLQYTTDDGESWFPMGHLFAPGAGVGLPATPGKSGRIGSGVGASSGSKRPGRERDRLAPLDVGAQADMKGNVAAASGRTKERPMKPKGPQHRTQRIEPSDSYVRIKDAIKPPVAYRIMRDGQESGPFEEPFLRRWVETGALEKDTPSRRDGTREWEPLWHLLKMSPPGPVEMEMAKGRRAMRSLEVTGKVLVVAGVSLLAWGISLPIMHTLFPISASVTVAHLRTMPAVMVWDFHPQSLWLLASFGLMSLAASLYSSSRWLWTSWTGTLAGAVWLAAAMFQHQLLLREHIALLRPPGFAGQALQREILERMGTLPPMEMGSVLMIIAVILIGIGALVMQLSTSSRWRRL